MNQKSKYKLYATKIWDSASLQKRQTLLPVSSSGNPTQILLKTPNWHQKLFKVKHEI